jgi:beta-phosphoglucomutase
MSNTYPFSIIFDMDGVLINSMSYVFDSLNLILKEYNCHIDPKDYPMYMGINTKKLQSLFKEQFNLNFTTDYLKQRTTELQIDLIKKHEKPSPSLISFLEELKENGIPFGIGTSSPKERTFEILNALNLLKYFDVIVNGDEIKHHKPNPETFLIVAKKLNSKPEDCTVFEDAKNGIDAAKAGNMKVIAVRTDFEEEDNLKNADMIIDGFDDIDLEKMKNLYHTIS